MSTPRLPAATPSRIAPLPNLPLFHQLAGRKAVVAGSSAAAVWKAELLAAAGAELLVLAGDRAQHFAHVPARVVDRGWTADDLAGAALAVADLPGSEAERFQAAARAAGVPANLVDRTDLCDFQFWTIVNRSPIVLTISTDGAAPMLGQSIRARIEAMLPAGMSAWGEAAARWRPRLKERVKDFAARRAFWQRFVKAAWAEPDRRPGENDFEDLLGGGEGRAPRGSVTLVGAGPGDPELLTLKAVRALQSATVILYDDLVGPDILELARREAIRISVGKTGHGPSCRQSDIDSRLVELASAGESVVRLKGGDPLVFGRATEELRAVRAAGLPVSIIPGISAAQGAAAALGFSLTERQHARRVQFVTGHGADGKLPSDLDWNAIADPSVTTVVYMPRRTLGQFVRKALARGLDPATPAVAVAGATRPDQTHVGAPVAEIDDASAGLPAGAPVIVLIGQVARDQLADRSTVLPFVRKIAS